MVSSPIILITGIVIIPSPFPLHFLPNKVGCLLSLCLVRRSVQVTTVIDYLCLKIILFNFSPTATVNLIQYFSPR